MRTKGARMKEFKTYIITVRGNEQFEFVGREIGGHFQDNLLSYEDEKGKLLNFNPKYIVCIEVIE